MMQPNHLYPQCYVDPVAAYTAFHPNNYQWTRGQHTNGGRVGDSCNGNACHLKDDRLSYMKAYVPAPHHPCNTARGEKNKDADEKNVSNWDKYNNSNGNFFGPQLWDKTIPCSSDLKFEYMDLDEFLNENDLGDEFFKKNISSGNFFPPQVPRSSSPHDIDKLSPSISCGQDISFENGSLTTDAPQNQISSPVVDTSVSSHSSSPCSPNGCSLSSAPCSSECPGSPTSDEGGDFDPRSRPFSEEDLKPQPMIKKSRKKLVPNEMKDDKYWARRHKNNLAAKRSRDARRVKENQIALRAGFLEKQNDALREELDKTRVVLEGLKKRLSAYESTSDIPPSLNDT